MPVGVYVCSSQKCGAVWSRDPEGHCPLCKQEDGSGWSTVFRELDPPLPMKIELTDDQKQALDEMAKSMGEYDGNAVVGKLQTEE